MNKELLVDNLGLKKNINFDKVKENDITFISGETELNLGDRKILVKNVGAAHSRGDIIYDYKTKTYIAGDIFQEERLLFQMQIFHYGLK